MVSPHDVFVFSYYYNQSFSPAVHVGGDRFDPGPLNMKKTYGPARIGLVVRCIIGSICKKLSKVVNICLPICEGV